MSNFTNANELMEPWAFTLAAVVLLLIGVLGFTLNILAITLMCKDMQLWNPINIILFNLICSDLSVSILGNPFALTAAINRQWIFGQNACTFYGFFMALLGINSIATMTVMSFERYYLVRFPFSSKQINNRGAKFTVFFIWCYSIAVTSPPLMGWGDYVNEAANISCSVNWETQTNNAKSYILFLFTFGLLLPIVIIFFSYVNIILTMKHSASRLGKTNRAERKVVCMVGIMITAFIISWTPYAIFALMKQFGDANRISPAMGVLPSIFAKTSICYNPIIYVGMNSQFRQAFDRFRGNGGTIRKTTINTTTNQLSLNIEVEDAKNLVKNRLQLLNAIEQFHFEHKTDINVELEMCVFNDKLGYDTQN